jgi:hypothetical protein
MIVAGIATGLPGASTPAIGPLTPGTTFGTGFTLAGAGNIGIGTTTPAAGLDVMNGFIHTSGQPSPSTKAQGTYLSWKFTCGVGETDFINNLGRGTGGWWFYNQPSSGSASPVLKIRYEVEGLSNLYFLPDPDNPDDYLDPLDFEDGDGECLAVDPELSQQVCEFIPGTGGYNYTDNASTQLFPNESLSIISISIDPTSAPLFETQVQSLSTNTNTGEWCLQGMSGACNSFMNGIPYGTLVPNIYADDDSDAVNASYLAPSNVLADTGSYTFPVAACVFDSITTENWACSGLTLNELAVSIAPTDPRYCRVQYNLSLALLLQPLN